MATLSGKGNGKWHDEAAFAKYKAKRKKLNKVRAASRKGNR